MRRKFVCSRPMWVLFASLFAGVLGASCGGGRPAPVSTSNNAPATAQLSVTPSAMSFGSLAIGSSQSQNGTLKAGGTSVTVSSASWNGSGYSLSGITFPTTIAAGSSVPFTVTFTPQTSGSAAGQVSFLSNATNSPTALVLSGSGTASPVQHSVDLLWNASSSPVAGYNIYRGGQAGGPYTKLNASLVSAVNFVDSSVQSGATYYYVATSVDSNNVESGYSNIATAVIP